MGGISPLLPRGEILGSRLKSISNLTLGAETQSSRTRRQVRWGGISPFSLGARYSGRDSSISNRGPTRPDFAYLWSDPTQPANRRYSSI